MQLVVAFGLGIRSVVAPESGVFVQGSIFFLLVSLQVVACCGCLLWLLAVLVLDVLVVLVACVCLCNSSTTGGTKISIRRSLSHGIRSPLTLVSLPTTTTTTSSTTTTTTPTTRAVVALEFVCHDSYRL